MARLRRVDPRSPGIVRVRRGRGFSYLQPSGAPVDDPEVLGRIDALALPPAWKDVWICADAFGHIQACGTDAAGRRQYRYHDVWRERRDRAKHDRVVEFAAVLPDLRDRVQADLERTDLDAARVLALSTRLLDLGFFRIGEERYAAINGTFGLATLRREHVTLPRDGETIRFDYLAKGGKRRQLELRDAPAARAVASLKRRRDSSHQLLAYHCEGSWRRVSSRAINDYLRDATGLEVSAKDFRTWHATVLMAVALAVSTDAVASPAARQRVVARAASEVAHYLGNTPAVCRRSYIDPRIIDRFNDGATVRDVLEELAVGSVDGEPATRGPIEDAVRQLLG